ncbi:MAG: MotA/TolQ/ExbB proton channel family protein [Elusimicrobia bacterium]|nr:MotA/TolQ/ExbB proton channel family protein [Candidatus Liberimonas magnetica]
MDLATIAGVLVGVALVLASILLTEGVKGFIPFLNYEAFMVVMGGTFCALLVNYPIQQVLRMFKVTRVVMTSTGEDTTKIVTTFVTLAKKSKQGGFLSLEGDIKNLDNDFLKRGVQMVVDGLEKEFIANMLETELGFIKERHKVGIEMFNALGTYAPAFGIIGTVLGMILMLNSITNVEEVPRRMAFALAAAFFGLGSGYLLFLPMAGKLRRRSDEELLIKEIIIRGVLLLQAGTTPSILEENLKAYLEPSQRALINAAR